MTKRQALAILTLFYAPMLTAQTAPNWKQQSPQSFPSERSGHAMAFDSAHSQTVLFGGDSNNVAVNDTWVWDGSNWTEESPQDMPPMRSNAAMAYDSAHGQVVLFGGVADNVALGDTWLWDGANWTEASPQSFPSARSGHAMAYDSAHGQVILFGGLDANNNALADTWLWDGAKWTQQFSSTHPPALSGHAMAYDSAHGQVVLFGGFEANNTASGDTWLWDGSNWTLPTPGTSPSARFSAAMIYDSAHGQTLLFGGRALSIAALGDTWAWDGSTWTEESPQTSPPARYKHAMAYDSVNNEAVLFGGRNVSNNFLGDTWTLNSGLAVSAVVSASDFGGFSAVAPGSWVEIYGSNLAPGTQGWTGANFTGDNAPTMLNGVSVSIGGQAAFVDYVSPTQVNAQLPSNISTGGTLQLTVTNGTETSPPVNVTVNPTEPGLLAPPSFKIGSNQYVVAQHSDGSYVLPVGAISGVSSSPAKPGETIVIYGVGFGSVIPNIPAGEIATVTNQLSGPLQILFGKTLAKLPYFGLAPNFVGLYQFNVTVPDVADNDLVPLTFNLGGVAGTQTLFTAVQQ
jgi:uncharacterized protein (TIGR03437 family)